MSNFRKILVVICVFALLSVGCVFAVAAAGINDGTVEELAALVDAAEKAADKNAKYNATLAVGEYINTKNIDAEAEGYAEVIARAHKLAVDAAIPFINDAAAANIAPDSAYLAITNANDLLRLYEIAEETEGYADAKTNFDAALLNSLTSLVNNLDANIETTLKTASNKVKINKVNRVLAECLPYGDAAFLDEVKANFATLLAAHERAVEKNLATLDDANAISNYDLPIFITEDWERQPVGMDKSNIGTSWTVDLKNASNKVGIVQEENGNKYYVHQYLEKAKPEATYIQMGLSKTDASKGLVFEFDIATFGQFPEKGIFIETGGVNISTGRVFPPHYFIVDGKGNITSNTGTIVLPNAFVKGQWLHIMIILEPKEFVYKLYVEGEFLAQYDAKASGEKFDHNKAAFRLSGQPSTSGEISYDNLLIYGGDSYRIHDKFDGMSDDEKFLYYVDYFSDTERSIAERNVAYNEASKLLEKYWAEDAYTEAASTDELKSAVDVYLTFDIEILLKDIKDKNLDAYISLVQDLLAIDRAQNTLTDRESAILAITEFSDENKNLIDNVADKNGNGTPDYTEYYNAYNTALSEARYDANAPTFIQYMSRFEKAEVISTKQRNFNKAKAMIDEGTLDLNLLTNPNHPARDNFPDLIAAYNTYVNGKLLIAEITRTNNSDKIIKCIDMIKMYTTEEEWLENEELMVKYLEIVKRVVKDVDADGNLLYDPEMDGVYEALTFYNKAYGFFYARLQTEHVEYISGILDMAAATEAYIEKLGLVSIIDRYLHDNDIDYNDARIIDLINDLETCKAELLLREEDYAKILIQNAVYFVNIVERMRTAQTYGEQREYFEQATALYFNIDITVDGAANAVAIYDEYKVKLDRIAESSIKFLEAVALYEAAETEDEKYAALVECYYNAQFVEMSYDGAKEAMATYQAAYDAYMGYVNAVNSDVTATGNAMGSLRANCGMLTIIAIIIKKLFGV